MTIRTNEKTVRFVRPFSLKGAERSFPAGAYRVITDEELIDGISLLAYRRVSTMILVPGGLHGSSVECCRSTLRISTPRNGEMPKT